MRAAGAVPAAQKQASMTARRLWFGIFALAFAGACSGMRSANPPLARAALPLAAHAQNVALFVADPNGAASGPHKKPQTSHAVFELVGGTPSCVTGTLAKRVKGQWLQCKGTTFNQPRGVAVDAQGILYVADNYGGAQLSGEMYKVTRSGSKWNAVCIGQGGTCSPPVPVFNKPYGVAVDGNAPADVFFTAYANGAANPQVFEAVGGSTAAAVPLPTPSSPVAPFQNPQGLAVDTKGNVFVADSQSGVIYEFIPNGNSWNDPVAAASGLTTPYAVAVDSQQNLYVAETNDNEIVELPKSGSSWGSPVCIPKPTAMSACSGAFFSKPHGLTWDASTNVLYVADSNHSAVKKVTLGNPGAVTCVPNTFATPKPCNGTNKVPGAVGFYLPNAVAKGTPVPSPTPT
jgi:hypothetical protein